MKPNREEEYPVFFHMIHPAEVLKISVFGDIELSYFGFGDESKGGRGSNNDNRVSDMYASPVVDHNDPSKPSHRLTNGPEPSKTIESDGSNIKKPS